MAITNGPNMGVAVNGAEGDAHYADLMLQWRAIDAFLMAVFIAIQNAPPATPADGDVYIVDTSPTGAWVGHAGKVARFTTTNNTWEFFTAKNGWQLNRASDGVSFKRVGGVWV